MIACDDCCRNDRDCGCWCLSEMNVKRRRLGLIEKREEIRVGECGEKEFEMKETRVRACDKKRVQTEEAWAC